MGGNRCPYKQGESSALTYKEDIMYVLVNGTFDILHKGHLKLLKYARGLDPKSYVTVAIDTDSRVKHLKGPTRPVNCQEDRREMLLALKYVDDVVFFSSDGALETFLQATRPDVMVKGADYRDKPIIGAQYCKRIDFVELTNDSTTKIIQSISNR